MNVLSEEQALTRQLALPREGLLEGLPPEFIAALQSAGSFVEYNQQVVVTAEEVVDYVSCIVAGRLKVSRLNADYAKAEISKLGAGAWFGETNLFARHASPVEISADGEAVIWTIPADMLRDLCFREPQGAQLLFNFGVRLTQKIFRR